RDRTPLASRAQNIHDPVHHFAHLDMALVAAALGGRDQWFDMRPFIVGQVTRQFAAVVTSAVLRRPHRWCPSRIRAPLSITNDSKCFRTDTQRIHRLRQGQSGQAVVWACWRWLVESSDRRTVEVAGRNSGHRACAISGVGTSDRGYY